MASTGSILMAYFSYNALNNDGRQYLYHEFPTYFTYNQQRRAWQPRKKGTAIGRMYHCSPLMGERYYLRLLLTVVKSMSLFAFLFFSFKEFYSEIELFPMVDIELFSMANIELFSTADIELFSTAKLSFSPWSILSYSMWPILSYSLWLILSYSLWRN